MFDQAPSHKPATSSWQSGIEERSRSICRLYIYILYIYILYIYIYWIYIYILDIYIYIYWIYIYILDIYIYIYWIYIYIYWILIAVWLQNSLPSRNQKRLRSSPFPRGKKNNSNNPKKTWLTVVFCLFLSASQKGSAIKRPDIHADVVPTNIKRNQHLSMQATSWGKRWLSFAIYIEYIDICWHEDTRIGEEI